MPATVLEAYPAFALVAILGGAWAFVEWRRRRFREAVDEAVRRLDGRYEPGGHTSGGTLYVKVEGRDVVFSFFLGSTSRPPSTTVSAILGRVLATPLRLRGKEAVERAPRFGRGAVLVAESNLLTATLPGVVRDGARLLDLATAAAALAVELER